MARVLFNRVFLYLGMPLRILSDQGPQFESNFFQELGRWMNSEKVRTTPYKASTNGMVERYHRTLNSILAKMISTNQRDWCERVPTAAVAYRASVHEATGFSPNFIVFGRENRMLIDLLCGCPPDDEEHYTSINEVVAQRQEMTKEVYEAVRVHLGEAAVRRKDRYDIEVKKTRFVEGAWVWYLYPRRRVGISAKWQKFYTGPYQIVRVIEPNNVVLQKSRRGKPFVVHHDKVKLFHGDPPGSWKPQTVTSRAPNDADGVGGEPTEPRGGHDETGNEGGEGVGVRTSAEEDEVERRRGGDGEGDDGAAAAGCEILTTFPSSVLPVILPDPVPDLPDGDRVRSARKKRRPAFLNDYTCRCISVLGNMSGERGRSTYRGASRCTICQRVYSRGDSLLRHMKAIHAEGSDTSSVMANSDGVPLMANSDGVPLMVSSDGVMVSSDDVPPMVSTDDGGETVPGAVTPGMGPLLAPTLESMQKHGRRAHAEDASSADRQGPKRLMRGRTAVSSGVSAATRGAESTTSASGVATAGFFPADDMVRRVQDVTAVTDEELVNAAAEVMSQGPAARLCDLVQKLQARPFNLPCDVARAIVVGARVAACDVASRKGDLEALAQSGRSVVAECLRKTLHYWGKEPVFVTTPREESRGRDRKS